MGVAFEIAVSVLAVFFIVGYFLLRKDLADAKDDREAWQRLAESRRAKCDALQREIDGLQELRTKLAKLLKDLG